MTINKTPDWAVKLIEQVCKDYYRALPSEVKWYEHNRDCSSGTYYKYYRKNWSRRGKKDVIFLRAGTEVSDQRLVLLHELAHHITNKRKSQGHTARFWHTAFELYERYGVGLDEAYKREKEYKKYAEVAYQKAKQKSTLAGVLV